jgi:hypothetical protein
MQLEEKLNNEIENLIKDDSLKDFTKEVIKVSLDNVLKVELLKEIPTVNLVHSILKFSKNISDYLFAKKLISFLNEIANTPSKERIQFVERINRKKEKVGETILFIISKSDSVDKSKMIGEIYKQCIEGNISYDELKRLCQLINKAFLTDLDWLKHFSTEKEIPAISRENLINIGAIVATGISAPATFGTINGIPIYNLSEIGKLYLKISS